MAKAKEIKAMVFYNETKAGILTKAGRHYTFIYDAAYLSGAESRPISITMPLAHTSYESDILFPVFVNMLSEGANKRLQCRMLKIDENDYFSLLLATTRADGIGPITVIEIDEKN